MRIIRVFPRRTKATPVDEYVRIGTPPGFFDEADEAHVSVTFTWDIPVAERLAEQWRQVAPVKVGGPAYGQPGGEFVPGMYLKHGYTITSRGCPNHCWFCSVWKREPELIELPIVDGWSIQDDNLLACSELHIRQVFAMLKRQPKRAEFTGGLEAKILKPWHVDLLADLKPAQMFFAYDTPDDRNPLQRAATMLTEAGFTRSQLRAYVLIGYPKDTMEAATKRLQEVKDMGICPYVMLYRNDAGRTDRAWRTLQREWARPAIIYAGSA